MLKISVQEMGQDLLLVLEGRLVDSWVSEVQRTYEEKLASKPDSRLTVDLCGVTVTDSAGEFLLNELFQNGATLRCSGVMNQYLVEQMSRETVNSSQGICRPCHFVEPEARQAKIQKEVEGANRYWF